MARSVRTNSSGRLYVEKMGKQECCSLKSTVHKVNDISGCAVIECHKGRRIGAKQLPPVPFLATLCICICWHRNRQDKCGKMSSPLLPLRPSGFLSQHKSPHMSVDLIKPRASATSCLWSAVLCAAYKCMHVYVVIFIHICVCICFCFICMHTYVILCVCWQAFVLMWCCGYVIVVSVHM